MLQQVEQHRQEIAAICRKYGVIRLDLFGSAASGQLFSSDSDIDFFFEFDANPVGLADRYFGLIEDLELLLQRNVDMVSIQDARNPYFLQVANQHRTTLYAA
jgi:predicted nucleotidyltransferase